MFCIILILFLPKILCNYQLKKMNKMKKFFTLLVVVLFCFSCSKIDFDLPPGPRGEAGASAYEVWKSEVEKGTITWPSTEVSIADYLRYIKGPKGDNGASAYEIWKQMIEGGNVEDPHNPGTMWDANKNTPQDFWKFIAGRDGKDGLTAYELWKKEVAAGHVTDNEGNAWPEDQIDMNDFFRNLKGEKGEQGEKGETGEQGKPGKNGLSAYELWKKDLAAGSIHNPDGSPWNKDANKISDFYDYLHGKDGKNGVSAYEMWKEMISSGNVDDPKNPGKKWNPEKNSEVDFWQFLAGKDGANGKDGKNGADGKNGKDGKDGLSAYELWKKDLADRCGTQNPIYKPGAETPWDCDRNTLDDFYSFLSGKDGQDGSDGRPGELGTPGQTVTIIKGVPNVIANYSQSEYSEYVRLSDGGVLYTVYDENGEIAPRATVQGMPGIDPQKIYTANDEGQFVVPREDLPWVDDLYQRWGKTSRVTIEGKEPKASAKNTYVPNKMLVRLTSAQSISVNPATIDPVVYIQRKSAPGADWEGFPQYLESLGTLDYTISKVSDSSDPSSKTDVLKEGRTYVYRSSTSAYMYPVINRYVIEENNLGEKNGYSVYDDGKEKYFTIELPKKLYGDYAKFNGTIALPPTQMSPTLKSIHIKGRNEDDGEVFFNSISGEFDFSNIVYSEVYKSALRLETLPNGVSRYNAEKYSEQEAKERVDAYISLSYNSKKGVQSSSSSRNKSKFASPTFSILTPYLNSSVSTNVSLLKNASGSGKLVMENGKYLIKWSSTSVPKTTVTFEP